MYNISHFLHNTTCVISIYFICTWMESKWMKLPGREQFNINDMKFNIVTTLIIMVLAAGTVNAQNINIGTKIGLNSYSISNDSGPSYDSKIGMHAGILGHIHLDGTDGQFALQPELVYSMQGGKFGNTNFNLDYLNIPIILQYMFDNGFRIQAGPQLGLLVRAKAEGSNVSADIKDDFKTLDLGLSFGVSYVHVPSSFGIDARYNLGLSDITESSEVQSTSRGLQIGVFYLFNHN